MLSDESILIIVAVSIIIAVIVLLVLFHRLSKESMCGGGDQLCKCTGNET